VKEDDDGTLVRRCLAGDRAAFEQLVVRYQKPVYNAALRLLRDPEEARDIAQTTFLKAFTHVGDYDPSYKFYSWIYRIAINESLHVLQRRKLVEVVTDDEADDAPGPDTLIESEQTSKAIEAALMRVKPELRVVIVLRHFLHLSYQDMSEVLQVPSQTVKSRLYTARQRLREQLAQREMA
jgi:RNA polymerase sigma-70 factor (ECF subfamily)